MMSQSTTPEEAPKPSTARTILKALAGIAFLASAVATFVNNGDAASEFPRRRLSMVVVGDSVPSYMDPVMKDLKGRKKLFDETPPEEVKYWFEYTGPLQVRTIPALPGTFLQYTCSHTSILLSFLEILLPLFQVAWQS